MRVIVTCTIEDRRNEPLSSADQRYEPYDLPTNDAIRLQIAKALRVTSEGGRVRVSAKLDAHHPIVTILPRDDLETAREYRENFLREIEYASIGTAGIDPTLDLVLKELESESATE